MKSYFKNPLLILLIAIWIIPINVYSQTRVAILDFENTSGIPKFDGFGKAMSNMLITDLKNSIHPNKVAFLERSQLNKILTEQGLQKSKNFDNNTAVSFGKLAGVKYVLVGSVYVLDGKCNLSSRLVNVQTSEIVHAKESNGKITNWLSLKTVLAQELSKALNNPVSIDKSYAEGKVTETTLTQYSKVIEKMDNGDVEGAKQMTNMLSELNPDFKYYDELKNEIEELKKEIERLKVRIDDAVDNPYQLAVSFINQGEDLDKAMNYLQMFSNRNDFYSLNFPLTKKLFTYYQYSRIYKRKGNYKKAISYLDSALAVDPYFMKGLYVKMLYLIDEDLINNVNNHDEILRIGNKITSYSRVASREFNPSVYRRTLLNNDGTCSDYNNKECDFYSVSIKLPSENGNTIFDNIALDFDMGKDYIRVDVISKFVNYQIQKNKIRAAVQTLENGLGYLFKSYSDSLKVDRWGDFRLKKGHADRPIYIKNKCERSLFSNILEDKFILNKKYDYIYNYHFGADNIFRLIRTYAYLKLISGDVKESVTILNYYIEVLHSIKNQSNKSHIHVEEFLFYRSLYRIALVLGIDFDINFKVEFERLAKDPFLEKEIRTIYNVKEIEEIISQEGMNNYCNELTKYISLSVLKKNYFDNLEVNTSLLSNKNSCLTYEILERDSTKFDNQKVFFYCKYNGITQVYNNYREHNDFLSISIYTESNKYFENEKVFNVYVPIEDSTFIKNLKRGEKLSLCAQLDLSQKKIKGYAFEVQPNWIDFRKMEMSKKYTKNEKAILALKESNRLMINRTELERNKHVLKGKNIFAQGVISGINNYNDYYSSFSFQTGIDEKYNYRIDAKSLLNKNLFKKELVEVQIGDTVSFVFELNLDKKNEVIGEVKLLDLGKLVFKESSDRISKTFDLKTYNVVSRDIFDQRIYNCLVSTDYKGYYKCYKDNSRGAIKSFYWYDYLALNNIAWSISQREKVNENDLEVAEELVRRSCEIMFYTNHNCLATYASILKQRNKVIEAKKILNMAIQAASKKSDFKSVEKYTNRLGSY